MAQCVKNPTAKAQVTVEVQVQFQAMYKEFKDLELPELQYRWQGLRFHPQPRNFHMTPDVVVKKKKKKKCKLFSLPFHLIFKMFSPTKERRPTKRFLLFTDITIITYIGYLLTTYVLDMVLDNFCYSIQSCKNQSHRVAIYCSFINEKVEAWRY